MALHAALVTVMVPAHRGTALLAICIFLRRRSRSAVTSESEKREFRFASIVRQKVL